MLLALLLTSAPAPVRLIYAAHETTCPPRERLVGAVSARLGTDPFREEATDVVDVQVRAKTSSLEAVVVRRAAAGELGRRELTSPTLDCTELFRALELAVATAIDPRAGLVRAARPATPPAIPSTAAPPIPHEEHKTSFLFGAGAVGSLGRAASPTGGVLVLLGVRRGMWGVELGGRIDLPAQLRLTADQRITTQAMTCDAAVCLALSALRLCAMGALGGLRVTSDGLERPARPEWTVLASAGTRIAGEWSFGRFVLRPFVEVGVALAHTNVVVDGTAVWRTPPVAGSLGLTLAFDAGDA